MMPAGWSKDANAQRLEDLWWMASTGECASGAARRLGITEKALEKWCARHDRDLWKRLLEREPRDHNVRNANQNQWTKGEVA